MARYAWDNALRWEQTLFCTPKFKTRVDAYIPFLYELEGNPHFTLLMKGILYSYENTKPLIWIYVYNLHPNNLDGRSRYDWSQERSCSQWLRHLPPGCTVTICRASVHSKTLAKLTRPGHVMDGKRWVSCAIILIGRNLEEGNPTKLHKDNIQRIWYQRWSYVGRRIMRFAEDYVDGMPKSIIVNKMVSIRSSLQIMSNHTTGCMARELHLRYISELEWYMTLDILSPSNADKACYTSGWEKTEI